MCADDKRASGSERYSLLGSPLVLLCVLVAPVWACGSEASSEDFLDQGFRAPHETAGPDIEAELPAEEADLLVLDLLSSIDLLPELRVEGGDLIDTAAQEMTPVPVDVAPESATYTDVPVTLAEVAEEVVAELPDPGAAGPQAYSVQESVLALLGANIPAVMFLPDGPGPYPVVVFTHGFQLSNANYTSYGEHLASWGYLVIMPQLPGSLFAPATHTALKEYVVAIPDWLEGATLPGGELEGKVDPALIGLSGHSMGGKISLLVCSEDERVKASLVLDPVDAAGGPFGGDSPDYPSVTPELMPGISIPIGLVGETVNATCSGFFCQACAPEDNNFQQYYIYAGGPAVEIELVGASHMSFLDEPDCGLTCSVCPKGVDDPSHSRLLARKYMTAFFNYTLLDQYAYGAYLTGDHMQADLASGLVITASKNGF